MCYGLVPYIAIVLGFVGDSLDNNRFLCPMSYTTHSAAIGKHHKRFKLKKRNGLQVVFSNDA